MKHLIGGIDFGEGPRWHEGRLWYSDFHQKTVYSVGFDGNRKVELVLDDQPSGLGWMPDGSMLVVSMVKRQVLRVTGDEVFVHADLSDLATWHCNDMVVSSSGHAYVGNFGFDLEGQTEPCAAAVIHVSPDGKTSIAADELAFPNGSVITPDEKTLIVGETFGNCYRSFSIREDGSLSEPSLWAEVPGMFPDGCTMDAEGAIWFADASIPRIVRVVEGGEILEEVETPQVPYACMLGGDKGTTLFVLTADSSNADQSGSGNGNLWMHRVDVPHAGLP
ncbi:MAG TPA: SMP-30/gluconolactonase/LRE family protein [Acidimicrobiales bacterium]|nr:SMP-30/gluconolactonase/LRE family protein [Acidimicrobiales bacterium]